MSSLGPVTTDVSASPVKSARPQVHAKASATRLADYAELAKPRIAVMALVTVAVGVPFYFLARRRSAVRSPEG